MTMPIWLQALVWRDYKRLMKYFVFVFTLYFGCTLSSSDNAEYIYPIYYSKSVLNIAVPIIESTDY